MRNIGYKFYIVFAINASFLPIIYWFYPENRDLAATHKVRAGQNATTAKRHTNSQPIPWASAARDPAPQGLNAD